MTMEFIPGPNLPVATATSSDASNQIANTRFVQTVIAAAIPASYSTYVPSISPNSGGFGSVSATGRWQRVGPNVQFEVSIVITTNGTAAGGVNCTLPATAGPAVYVVAGRCLSSGKMAQGVIAQNSASMLVVAYDNTYPGGSGETICLSGFYEGT